MEGQPISPTTFYVYIESRSSLYFAFSNMSSFVGFLTSSYPPPILLLLFLISLVEAPVGSGFLKSLSFVFSAVAIYVLLGVASVMFEAVMVLP